MADVPDSHEIVHPIPLVKVAFKVAPLPAHTDVGPEILNTGSGTTVIKTTLEIAALQPLPVQLATARK